MNIYLDYDGVLHPEDVRQRSNKPPAVFVDGVASGVPLFQHMQLLEDALAPYPDIRIVLSTSWVPTVGYGIAKAKLSAGLQSRVSGSTWHSHMQLWDGPVQHVGALSRYQSIVADASRRQQGRWLAIDDDLVGWPEDQLHRVVAPTDPILGLSQPGIIEQLMKALACQAS